MAMKEKKTSPTCVVPQVLVLLATHNGRRWLPEQLDSILAQQGVDVHVLIGDDASTDNTAGLIRTRWQHDQRVELVQWDTPSGSAGANFRRLYRHADGYVHDLVALADQDDIWAPGKLERAAHMLASTGAAGYSCAVEAFWPTGRTTVVKQCDQARSADFLFEGGGQGCTFVITRTLFLQLQDFSRRHHALSEALHYHDWLVYLLARVTGGTWHFDARPYVRYRQHGSNEIGSRGGVRAVWRRLEMIRSGWFRRQIAAAFGIVQAYGTPAVEVAAIRGCFDAKASIGRRVRLARLALVHGRRRLGDRVVMVLAALKGWI